MSSATMSGITGFSTDLFYDNRYVELVSNLDQAGFHLRELNGIERIGHPFEFTIKAISQDPIRDLASVVGSRMTVGLKLKEGGNRYFNGLVTRFCFAGIDDTRRCNYIVEVRSWLTLLDRRQNCRLFQSKTALDIIKAIFADYPSALFRDATIVDLMRVRPLCVQWNETDLAFVSRLMEEEGLYYFFEHTSDAHELVLVNDVSAHQPCPEDDEIETHLNLSRAQIHNDMIFGWYDHVELQPNLVTLNDYDFEKPQTSLLNKQPVIAPTSTATVMPPAGETTLEVYNYPGNYRDSVYGARYALLRAEEMACRITRSWIETNARNLVPGYTFMAANPYDQTANATTIEDPTRYLLLGGEFTIVAETGERRKSTEAHFLFSGKMEALLATVQFRPAHRTPRPLIAGPQTAIVAGVPGEEISTDIYGRIKVQFMWDREGLNDENSSPFIRVSQSWAGRGWGGLVTPRIGQEVVVQFLNGNPDWPIITGAVYNATNMPPYALPEEATRSTFKSRSSIATPAEYNELRFEDLTGSEEVYMRAQKDLNGDVVNDLTLMVGRNANVEAKSNTTIAATTSPGDAQASTVELDSSGIIKVSCGTNITIQVSSPTSSIVIDPVSITMTAPLINLVGEVTMGAAPA
jgi:type VI secretion system secreted protein VgrG